MNLTQEEREIILQALELLGLTVYVLDAKQTIDRECLKSAKAKVKESLGEK